MYVPGYIHVILILLLLPYKLLLAPVFVFTRTCTYIRTCIITCRVPGSIIYILYVHEIHMIHIYECTAVLRVVLVYFNCNCKKNSITRVQFTLYINFTINPHIVALY